MFDGERNGQNDAHNPHDNVRPTQEAILASKPGGRGEHYEFLAVERRDRIVIQGLDLDGISFLQISVDFAVQLLEGRQTGRAHPHNEILVVDRWELYIQQPAVVQIRVRVGCLIHLEFRGFITGPCDTLFLPVGGLGGPVSEGLVADGSHALHERAEAIHEEGTGNQTAGIVGLALRVVLQRITRARIARSGGGRQLRVGSRFDIATVVLIEVCELVVEIYRRVHVLCQSDQDIVGACGDIRRSRGAGVVTLVVDARDLA